MDRGAHLCEVNLMRMTMASEAGDPMAEPSWSGGGDDWNRCWQLPSDRFVVVS